MDNEEIIKLDPSLIKDGEIMLKVLDGTEIAPSAALWFYFRDLKSWRLVISSSYFNKKNPQDCYKKVIESINKQKFIRLYIGDITLLPADDNLINILKVAIRTDKKSISGIRFTSSVINGVLIDDAYIYRLS